MVRFAPSVARNAAIFLLALAILLTAACTEPAGEATQLPPANTPVPGTTAAPGATPTPAPPPAHAPTFTPVSVTDLDVTEHTTIGDLLAGLSEEETACLRDAVGPEALETASSVPLAVARTGTAALPVQCFTPEHAIDVGVAFMSAAAGGLSRASRDCIRGVAVESPGALWIGAPAADHSPDVGATIRLHLCLTDEEAEALSTSRGVDLPPPSGLRCMQGRLGGPDALVEVLSTDEPDHAAAFSLLGAALACDTQATQSGG